MSTPQPDMSQPLQESVSDLNPNTLPMDEAQDADSSPDPGAAISLIDTPTKRSSQTDIMGTAKVTPPTPASSSSHRGALIFKPIPEVPREHLEEAPGLEEVPQRVALPTVQAPTTVSTGEGGSGDRGHANIPPRRSVRVTRPYATPDNTAHAPRRINLPSDDPYRRSLARYPDSEATWHLGDDREPSHEGNVRQRLGPTITVATEELFKAKKRAARITWAQNIALTLEVLIGALTTALGAALTGNKTRIVISILGVSSTLVASYLARTRGSNEPSESRVRARELGHLLRDVNSFSQDHGHEFGDKWDDQITGFRHSLERILGRENEKQAGSEGRAASPREKKRPVASKCTTPEPMGV